MDLGESDLPTLLAQMQPRIEHGEWVFVTVDPLPVNLAPLATFRETEGLSVIVTRDEADRHELGYDVVLTWISLTVHSALSAVGLTAAISAALSAANISCNVVAALRHDHIFVPSTDARRALSVLQEVSLRG